MQKWTDLAQRCRRERLFDCDDVKLRSDGQGVPQALLCLWGTGSQIQGNAGLHILNSKGNWSNSIFTNRTKKIWIISIFQSPF